MCQFATSSTPEFTDGQGISNWLCWWAPRSVARSYLMRIPGTMSVRGNVLRRGAPVPLLMATPNRLSPLSVAPSALSTAHLPWTSHLEKPILSPPCACRRPYKAHLLVVVGSYHAILRRGPPHFALRRSLKSTLARTMWVLLRRWSSAAVTLFLIARSSDVATDLPIVRTCCRRGCRSNSW